MIIDIVHDPIFLGVNSDPATEENLHVEQDSLDTLIANEDGCIGMAVSMIGVHKRVIMFDNEGTYLMRFGPEILKQFGQYDAKGGCLSLLGIPHKCKRYQTIKVQWQNAKFQICIKPSSVRLHK